MPQTREERRAKAIADTIVSALKDTTAEISALRAIGAVRASVGRVLAAPIAEAAFRLIGALFYDCSKDRVGEAAKADGVIAEMPALIPFLDLAILSVTHMGCSLEYDTCKSAGGMPGGKNGPAAHPQQRRQWALHTPR
jgi:hypothetical protein